MKTKVNKTDNIKETGENALEITKNERSLVVIKANDDDDQLIDEIESSLQQEFSKIDSSISQLDEGKAKLEAQKEEFRQINSLLGYWKETQKAANLLKGEDVNVEVTVSINGNHDVVTLKSTKVDTVKAVIDLLSNSSRERMRSLIKQRV